MPPAERGSHSMGFWPCTTDPKVGIALEKQGDLAQLSAGRSARFNSEKRKIPLSLSALLSRRGYSVRAGAAGDGQGCFLVFHAAVHEGAADFYSARERAAWSPGRPSTDWDARIGRETWRVAVDRRGRIIGFMSLEEDGHLGMAYVAPARMGTGVSDALYQQIEAAAHARGLPLLTTQASHLAQRFFARHGWHTDARQSVIRNGVALSNFRMHKPLT